MVNLFAIVTKEFKETICVGVAVPQQMIIGIGMAAGLRVAFYDDQDHLLRPVGLLSRSWRIRLPVRFQNFRRHRAPSLEIYSNPSVA